MSEDYYFTLTDIYVSASWTRVVDVTLEIDILRRDTLEILDVIKLSYTSVNKVEFTKKYYNDTKKVFRIPANVQIQVIVTLTFSASITWGSGSFRAFQIRTPSRLINFDSSTSKYFIEIPIQWKIDPPPVGISIDDEIKDYLTPDVTSWNIYVNFVVLGVFEYASLIDARTNTEIARVTPKYVDYYCYDNQFNAYFSVKNLFDADLRLRLYSSQIPLYMYIMSSVFANSMVATDIPYTFGNRIRVRTKSIGSIIICSDSAVYIDKGVADCLAKDFSYGSSYTKAYCNALPSTEIILQIPQLVSGLLEKTQYNTRITIIVTELTDEDKKALACYLQ
jgi:hypothetical protein